MNRTLKVYPAFKDFYGLEETIERIVGFFRHAAQGLEEKKQILYLLGPRRRRQVLAGRSPQGPDGEVPDLRARHQRRRQPDLREPARPVRSRHPWGACSRTATAFPQRLLMGNMSPWAVKRLDEFGGDISKFSVVKLHPSKLRQICVAKTEPGDENNQDISALVGKVDIRKLEHFGQNDADAYSYSGGLNRTTQGVLEFVEMFKAPLKMLHPLLDRHAGPHLRRHRERRRHALPGPHHRPLQRERVAELPRQQEQRGVPRPHQRHQGALLPARHGGEADLREAAGRRAS